MKELFSAEMYRLSRKRNMYLYFGAIALGYLLIVFMRSRGLGPDSVVTDAATVFGFMPALLGGFLFTSLFTDDLTARNLITLVGNGISRTQIVLTKFLALILTTAIAFALLLVWHLACYAIFGAAAAGPQIGYVAAIALQLWLVTLGFSAVAACVVYGTQKATVAVVAYFMLAFNVVTMLVNIVTSQLNLDLSSRLFSGTSVNIMSNLMLGGNAIAPAIEYLVYLILAIVAAIVIFAKREMEF